MKSSLIHSGTEPSHNGMYKARSKLPVRETPIPNEGTTFNVAASIGPTVAVAASFGVI